MPVWPSGGQWEMRWERQVGQGVCMGKLWGCQTKGVVSIQVGFKPLGWMRGHGREYSYKMERSKDGRCIRSAKCRAQENRSLWRTQKWSGQWVGGNRSLDCPWSQVRMGFISHIGFAFSNAPVIWMTGLPCKVIGRRNKNCIAINLQFSSEVTSNTQWGYRRLEPGVVCIYVYMCIRVCLK